MPEYTANKPVPPPIQDRPVCPQCKKTLVLQLGSTYTRNGDPSGPNRGYQTEYDGTYTYTGAFPFCTLKCAAKYARIAFFKSNPDRSMTERNGVCSD